MAKPTNAAIVDLKGRKWTPFETTGATGYVSYTEDKGEIHIPYGTDPVSKTIQAHELAHVRYTAKAWTGSTENTIKRLTALAGTNARIVGYAEDMRITALAGRLNVKTLPEFGNSDDAPVIKGWIESFVSAGIPAERVQKAARFILGNHTTVVAHIGLALDTLNTRENAERYIVFCAQHIHKLLSKGDDSDKSEKNGEEKTKSDSKSEKSPKGDKSDKSSDASDKPEEGEPTEGDDSSESSEGDSGDSDDSEGDDTSEGDSDDSGEGDSDSSDSTEFGDADGEGNGEESKGKAKAEKGEGSDGTGGAGEIDIDGLNLPDIRQAMLNSVPAPVDTEKLIQEFQHTLDSADWIPVPNIERVPLVRRAAQARRKGRKLSETGVVLGSAYDAVSPNERRPFVAKRKGGTGGLTVVIDCSGSMAIGEDQIEKLLTAHPQGVVVTYSSDVYSNKAVVRVIASHGRIANASDFRDIRAGANGCDGPVLEWLAKQPGERVWVCDGMITGHGDQLVNHSENARDAWLKAHRITRHHSLRAYLTSLR